LIYGYAHMPLQVCGNEHMPRRFVTLVQDKNAEPAQLVPASG
jgi:hypothetical protein